MRRIFIENDPVIDESELETHLRMHDIDFKFDQFITDAFTNSKEAFEAILLADEVYASTAFIGQSAQVFDALAYHLLNAGVSGKKLFIFRPVERLHLWNIHGPEAFKKLFEVNELYCEVNTSDGVRFEIVNAKNIL